MRLRARKRSRISARLKLKMSFGTERYSSRICASYSVNRCSPLPRMLKSTSTISAASGPWRRRTPPGTPRCVVDCDNAVAARHKPASVFHTTARRRQRRRRPATVAANDPVQASSCPRLDELAIDRLWHIFPDHASPTLWPDQTFDHAGTHFRNVVMLYEKDGAKAAADVTVAARPRCCTG